MAWSKEKRQEYSKAWYRRNKDRTAERQRDLRLQREYGLSAEQYDILLESQHGVCALCRRADKSGYALAVDHDHKDGRVRGLLCGQCNRALGLLEDDVVVLARAIDYLKR